MTQDATALFDSLNVFQAEVNRNPRLKGLLKDWNPTIILESSEGKESFSMKIDSGAIREIRNGKSDDAHTILIQATLGTLTAVFTGRTNPAKAVLDGELNVFGTDKDQVKLDAISLVLWGL